MATKIEWAEETWNPIIGCSHKSPGCDHCYAERMAGRLANMGNNDYEGVVLINRSLSPDKIKMPLFSGKWNHEVRFIESALEKPFKWKKPRRIFVCSMGDLFHESVPVEWIARVFAIMFLNQHHTFLLLTKRPERIERCLKYDDFWFLYYKYCNHYHDLFIKPLEQELYFFDELRSEWPLSNVWFGVTCENQEMADKRIPVLLQIPAAKRFVSIEPMLESVDLTSIKGDAGSYYQVLEPIINLGDSSRPALDWVIIGAESGPKRRECKTEWVESIIKQCKVANTPLLVKQLFTDGKKVSLPEINGKAYNQYPK